MNNNNKYILTLCVYHIEMDEGISKVSFVDRSLEEKRILSIPMNNNNNNAIHIEAIQNPNIFFFIFDSNQILKASNRLL